MKNFLKVLEGIGVVVATGALSGVAGYSGGVKEVWRPALAGALGGLLAWLRQSPAQPSKEGK